MSIEYDIFGNSQYSSDDSRLKVFRVWWSWNLKQWDLRFERLEGTVGFSKPKKYLFHLFVIGPLEIHYGRCV